MRRSLKLLVGVLVALAITPTAALAEGVVTVGDGEAATTCASLAEAVDRAEEGDTIALGEGTYAVESPLVISKSLTIQGAGADKTVLQFDEVEAPVDLITVDGGDVSFALVGVCVQGAGPDVLVGSSALTVGSAADPNGGSIVIEGCVFACPTVNVIVLNGGDASLSDNELLCAGCADSLSYGVTVDHGATATFAGNRISGYDALDGGGFVSAVAAQRGGRVVSFAGNAVEGCDVALCLYTYRMEGDTASLPDDVSANSFVDCHNTLSYEIDGEGDLAAILETALPGTTVSLLGGYTLTSAAAVKDGVWLFLADASSSLGVGNVTLAQGGSLTVEKGGTLTVSENATLFGDVTNYGSVYRFGTIAGEVTGDGYVTGLPLVDVQEGTWYYDSVEFVYAYGLMTGYSDGSDRFGTLEGFSRAEASTVLWRALSGDDSAPECPLDDVEQGTWYAKPVNWAYATGLITGYEDGSGLFGVGDPLTREQFAAIMARALGADLSSVDESVLGSFSDGNETSGWAASAMSWAVETGILRGSETADGSMELRPGADILRGEMAVMIKRAVDSGMLPVA